MLLQIGMISRKAGFFIGLGCAFISGFLAWKVRSSVTEVLEFNEAKAAYDSKIIQSLKDLRAAEEKFKEANGAYTGNLDALRDFVKNGTYPMIRAIGQVPDTLTEQQALEMKLIVRDTIRVSVLDSTFGTRKALEGRTYPFDPNGFINSPVSGKPFLLRAGMISSSGRNAPVVICKDPTPMVIGDTLMFGSLEKATVAGNWKGD